MKTYCQNIEGRVAAFIERESLLHCDAPVVVALSGGADSVALLAILKSLGYDCRAAHCNFHLRGEESIRDMRHATAIAERLDIDIYIRDFDVEAYRREHPCSVEMACRDLRYAWFAELLDREAAQAVAVGHHSEDRIETFMLNLVRGTGIAGLTSMRPRSANVVRPLLCLTRPEIEAYLSARSLTFIEDSSNASDAHRRNRLRNHILPLLEESFPGAAAAIMRTVANLEATEKVYRVAINEKIRNYRKDNAIDLQRLAADECAQSILFEMVYPLGFTPTQVSDMLFAVNSSGRCFLSQEGKVVAELSHGSLRLTDAATIDMLIRDDTHVVDLRHDIAEPAMIAVSHLPVENFHPEPLGAAVAYIDASALDGNPLWELRHPRRGDRMVPFGAMKSKLLSDIFASVKYSASDKREQWVLTRDGEIVWLPGLRNSALWSIGPETKRYIRLFYKNGKITT